jgi:hypothetical protein
MSREQSSVVPDIDFARPQSALYRRIPWSGWAMLLAALLLAAVLVADYANRLALRSTMELEVRQGRVQQSRDPAVSAAVTAEMRFADAALAAGRIPWEALFSDIEAAAAPGIVLLRLHPRGASREIHITGEAAEIDVLAAYLLRLGSRPGLNGVRLLGHQPLARNGGPAVRFELVVGWRGE